MNQYLLSIYQPDGPEIPPPHVLQAGKIACWAWLSFRSLGRARVAGTEWGQRLRGLRTESSPAGARWRDWRGRRLPLLCPCFRKA